jgi:hypothetical protein
MDPGLCRDDDHASCLRNYTDEGRCLWASWTPAFAGKTRQSFGDDHLLAGFYGRENLGRALIGLARGDASQCTLQVVRVAHLSRRVGCQPGEKSRAALWHRRAAE